MRTVDLSPRAAEILHSIVESHIESGEPVASRTISRHRRDRLSPATIRNVMQDLTEMGYLCQPHTSAGRVPTEKAFRSYVQSLATRKILAAELHRLQGELSQPVTLEGRVERSSHLLTELTRNIGIAAAIPSVAQLLDQIELVALGDRRVLMVVVTQDRIVHDQLVTLDEPVAQDELNTIRNYLNHNFSGWKLADIRAELQRRLEKQSAAYDAMLRRLTVLYEKGLLDIGTDAEVHLEGVFNLLGLDLHLTREKLRELFRALEQKKKILQLLDRFLEQPPGEVAVQVGLGDLHPSMREFSLIGISVRMNGGLAAKVAVLGPMRMNYQRVISAVVHVGEAMHSLPQ
ncbi:MAG TPA: heat-inducible transcription repressor HrcA [Solibacterales bacterium]|nr:heat-inducible transcription repressor HrcA [Bryobacterales bacterium]